MTEVAIQRALANIQHAFNLDETDEACVSTPIPDSIDPFFMRERYDTPGREVPDDTGTKLVTWWTHCTDVLPDSRPLVMPPEHLSCDATHTHFFEGRSSYLRFDRISNKYIAYTLTSGVQSTWFDYKP